MMQGSLIRTHYTEYGTFGVFSLDHRPVMVTLEPPWYNNKRNVSCIPVGKYNAVRCNCSPEYAYGDSPKYGNTFVIESVPGRWQNVFHAGNTWEDTNGCPLTGSNFGTLNDLPAVLNSRKALLKFLALTGYVDFFPLTITNHNLEMSKGYVEPEWPKEKDLKGDTE